jgi:hypothetical protein
LSIEDFPAQTAVPAQLGQRRFPPPCSARWAAVSADSLNWAHWESDTSVFNAITGETHLLSALPAATLDMLSSASWGFDALSDQLARVCEAPNDASWQDKIVTVLDGLEGLELIECVDERPRPLEPMVDKACAQKTSEP